MRVQMHRQIAAPVHLPPATKAWRHGGALVPPPGASRTLQQRYYERYGVEVTNIPNGVNLETVPPHKEIHALGFQGANYFLFMGKISPEEGCKEMIGASCSLASRPTKLVVTELQRRPLTARTRAAQCRRRGVREQLPSCHEPGIDARPRLPLREERRFSSLGKYCLPELPTQQGCSGPGGGQNPTDATPQSCPGTRSVSARSCRRGRCARRRHCEGEGQRRC